MTSVEFVFINSSMNKMGIKLLLCTLLTILWFCKSSIELCDFCKLEFESNWKIVFVLLLNTCFLNCYQYNHYKQEFQGKVCKLILLVK